MRRNPEFLRNCWLEITIHRLVATPLILGAIYYLVLFSRDNNESVLLAFSLGVFVLQAGLRGGVQAESSVVTEIQNRTWPLQRLTSINPWTMTWGKLFGSTLFSWYGALWSLLVFTLTWFLTPENQLFPHPDDKWVLLSYGIGPAVLFAVGLALWFQAWGLLVGMCRFQDKESKSKRKPGTASIISIVFLFFLVLLFQPLGAFHGLHWYVWEFNQFLFGLASLYIFLGWLMIGIYMQMRRELQVPNPPWVWLAFMGFLVGYVMGFPQSSENYFTDGLALWFFRILCGWVLLMVLTYLILWWERSDGVGIHRLLHLWNARRLRDALCEVPRWLFSLVLAWAAAVVLLTLNIILGVGGESLANGEIVEDPFRFIIAMMFFLMRDIALLLYFYFGDKPQRALGTAFVYWIVLYLLVPLLLDVAGLDALRPLFLPNDSVHIAYAILPALAQAVLMWTLTIRRWRTRFGSPAA